MRRLPLLPTLLVLLAVPAMIALGVWQLRRAEWKEGLLARLEANRLLPLAELPATLDDEALGFRRFAVRCDRFGAQQQGAARDVAGRTGYRTALACLREGADPVMISLGIAHGAAEADAGPMPTRFTGPLVPREGEPRFLLVAETPAPGLVREAPPSPDVISNNHRGYAFQWFAFAMTLALIYGIYARQWRRRLPPTLTAAP